MNFICDTLAGASGSVWNYLLSANLGVSENRLWADLFKAAGGLLAFCLVGLPISLKSSDGIPRQMLKELRSHDSLRRYRLLPSLNVWLVLNIPFSLALSLQSANRLLTTVLGIVSAALGFATVRANYELLADNRRIASVVSITCTLMLLAILASRLLFPISPRLDSLATIIAVLGLFLGIASAFATTYASDLSHVALRLAGIVRAWHSEETTKLQEPFEELKQKYLTYQKRFEEGKCAQNRVIESRFADVGSNLDNFMGFKSTGDGVCLVDLSEICEEHEKCEKGIPELTRQLAEYLGVKGGDTSSDPFRDDS